MTSLMRTRIVTAFASIIFFSTADNAIGASVGYRAGQATALELIRLPKFCWWEYDARYAATLQLIQNCGPFTNHYCPGELEFMRSMDVTKPNNVRLKMLRTALQETEYTIKGLKDYPACPMRSHAIKKYGEMRASFLKYGQPMPPNILGPAAK